MKIRSLSCFTLLILLPLSLAGPAAGADAADGKNGRFTQSVQHFVDTVLEHGRDVYGPQKSPLFVDGLHVRTFKPAVWKGKDEDWVLSNFASQQSLLRTLDGLTALTGRPEYRQAAEAAATHALGHLATPNGLLYWGGHMAWDLEHDKPVGQGGPRNHELKNNEPHYALMWRVNPQATRRLLEGLWAGHILDWSRLDYNRHASATRVVRPDWGHAFDAKIQVPFPAVGDNLSFTNVTPPLMHAGVTLATLGQSEEALTWTRRLVHRWQEGRDPQTGLCGGQLSYRKLDRAWEALGHVHPEINEAKIVASYHQVSRYHNLPLAQMQSGEDLIAAGGTRATLGRRFIQWGADDLKTYARRCYDPKRGEFAARMTDGTPIRWREARRGYYIPESFAPCKPDGQLLWAYATAWRLTRDPAHWEMSRELGRRLGLGDLGSPEGGRKLDLDAKEDQWQTLYGLLELHRATHDGALLTLASRIGDNLRRGQSPSGLFPRTGREYARTSDEVPLALLHLAAALADKGAVMPPPRCDSAFFHCVYHGSLEETQQKRDDARTYDHMVFYGPR